MCFIQREIALLGSGEDATPVRISTGKIVAYCVNDNLRNLAACRPIEEDGGPSFHLSPKGGKLSAYGSCFFSRESHGASFRG